MPIEKIAMIVLWLLIGIGLLLTGIMMRGGSKMIELGIAVLIGILVGAGGAVGMQKATKKAEPGGCSWW